MSVNNPDEWSEFRLWLNAQLEWLRCVEPQKDLRLLDEARGLFPAVGHADGATRAVAGLERLAGKAWSTEGTTMLNHYLGYALAARAVEVRRTLGPGGVVIVEGLAERILGLDTCDSELDEFAESLKRHGREREARTVQRTTPVLAVLLLVCGVVPVVVGGLLHNGTMLSVGVLLTVVLLGAFAWLSRVTGPRRPAHLGAGR